MFNDTPRRIGEFVLKYRWPIIIINNLFVILLFIGFANRGMKFQEHEEYMKTVQNNPLKKDPNHVSPPPVFDADYHIWYS